MFMKQNVSMYMTLKSELHKLKHKKTCAVSKHFSNSFSRLFHCIHITRKIPNCSNIHFKKSKTSKQNEIAPPLQK